MPTRPLKSIKGYRLRLTRLDACGAPVDEPDECRTVVTDGFISVTLSGQYREGRTYESENIWGDLCVNDKEPGQLVRATMAATFCDVNPDVLDIMGVSEPVLHNAEAIGVSFSTERRWESFALEVWTRSLSGCEQWGYFSLPFCRSAQLSDSPVIANTTLTVSVESAVLAAPSTWGTTPYAANPFMEPFPTGHVFGMVVTEVPPPALSDLSLCIDRLLPGGVLWLDACESETV
jgi:hypothetical protein